MRIRTVRPEFWSDERVADLDDFSKLVFIGTWNLADDSGFFRWSVRSIAGDLFRYDRPERREKKVARALEVLIAAGRIRILACGSHAVVPKFARHQHLAGTTRQVHTIRREHESECTRGDERGSAESRDVEESRGKVSREEESTRAHANGQEEAIENNRRILKDPTAAEVAKLAARKTLERMGIQP